jgi:uncharacterized membrane protein
MRLPPSAPRLLLTGALGAACVLVQMRGVTTASVALAVAALVVAFGPARFARALLAAGAAIGVVVVVASLWPAVAAVALSLLPSLGMLLLAWHFGATLRPGSEPLITHYIRADFGDPPAECVPYGRALTGLWTLVFLGFAALHLAPLLGLLSAALVGTITLVVSLVLFLGEHAVRARRFPQHPVALGRTLRAMWHATRPRHAR